MKKIQKIYVSITIFLLFTIFTNTNMFSFGFHDTDYLTFEEEAKILQSTDLKILKKENEKHTPMINKTKQVCIDLNNKIKSNSTVNFGINWRGDNIVLDCYRAVIYVLMECDAHLGFWKGCESFGYKQGRDYLDFQDKNGIVGYEYWNQIPDSIIEDDSGYWKLPHSIIYNK